MLLQHQQGGANAAAVAFYFYELGQCDGGDRVSNFDHGDSFKNGAKKRLEKDAFDEHTDEKKRPTIVSRFWKVC